MRLDIAGLLAHANEAVAAASANFAVEPVDVPRSSRQERNDRPGRGGGTLDDRLLEDALAVIDAAETRLPEVRLSYETTNRERSLGSRLAGELAKRYGDVGLPDGSVEVEFTGVAGQSFGAFTLPGTTLTLVGEAQDYVGKSMAGGTLAIRPADAASDDRGRVIAGNTLLYGATGGALFAAGAVGERVCVRNSGATAVVEGCGDHGCEYMTGGTVVVLGSTGRNFAAGMSGGVAYVLDESDAFQGRLNPAMVKATRLGGGTATAGSDSTELKALLERHLAHTGSKRAAALLGDWEAAKAKFWKVEPVAEALPTELAPAEAAAD